MFENFALKQHFCETMFVEYVLVCLKCNIIKWKQIFWNKNVFVKNTWYIFINFLKKIQILGKMTCVLSSTNFRYKHLIC